MTARASSIPPTQPLLVTFTGHEILCLRMMILMFSKNFNQEMMQNKREFEAMEGFFLPDEQR